MPIVDHIEELIDKKKEYSKQKELDFIQLHQQYRRKLVSENNSLITPHMSTYIEDTIRDPAPHVKGIDWNFNRGSLGLIERGDKNFLVTAKNHHSLKFLELNPTSSFKGDESSRNENRFINELMVNDKFIGVRRKKTIRIANLEKVEEINDEDVIEASDKYEYKTVNELIASTICNHQLIVVDSNQNLVKYDMLSKRANFTFQFPKTTSSRLCVMPYSVNALNEKFHLKISFTNCLEFGFIDCRNKTKEKILTFPFENHFVMKCEKILNHCHSLTEDNITYVVSSHMLYCFDHRQMKQPIVRWAHNVRKPPMMMSTRMFFGNEMICLSSNAVGDLKIFNFDGSNFNHLPFTPLSIQNSYNESCEEGHFLLSNIRDRVQLSTTGIVLKTETENLRTKLFTQNIAGDVFETILTLQKSPTNCETTHEYFKQWHDLIDEPKDPNEYLATQERLERKDLIVDDIVRVEGIAKLFMCKELQSWDTVAEEDDKLITQRHPAWKISIEKARNFKDLLAKEIMNVWDDIEIEDVKPALFADALKATEQSRESSSDRVTRWLRAANDESIIIEEISFTEGIELPEFNSTQIQSQTIDIPTQETSTPFAGSKKKKPRVAGF